MPVRAPHGELERLAAELDAFVRDVQQEICRALEALDGAARFRSDAWERPGGGGGVSRVLEDGAVFEKATVSVSSVHGELPLRLAARVSGEGGTFAATGLSVVIHPCSPMIPTTHMNVRLVRRGDAAWFGGGTDLTPYYLEEQDCSDFHRALREVCERHEPGSYARHKAAADSYFYLPHRGEHRGVGGIFFEDADATLTAGAGLAERVARAFLPAYLPIVERRRGIGYGARERRWQEIRRGRYVEFNLLLDRGTVFGLESGGRTESILASLPPAVRWAYAHEPDPGSREAALLDVLRVPREWA
ncbi:MAG TPA: oxygen-dependent coproporphyrinogen oxidase [Anaeromyxobacteraceae bacterium]|nr:oxygen-dependent coproporphyrinogen oxidase [Anaeromyxobacteraceae bacterium]